MGRVKGQIIIQQEQSMSKGYIKSTVVTRHIISFGSQGNIKHSVDFKDDGLLIFLGGTPYAAKDLKELLDDHAKEFAPKPKPRVTLGDVVEKWDTKPESS